MFQEAESEGTLTGGDVRSDPMISEVATGEMPGVTSSSDGGSSKGAAAWIHADGSFAENWQARLSGDLQTAESLKTIKTVEDLAKSYVATKRMIGARFEAPGEKATAEQLAAWRRTVGAPERPDGYLGESNTLRPDTIPETMWDAASERAFLELAHKHHLTPTAVREIAAFHGQSLADGMLAAQEGERQNLERESTALRHAWGQDYDVNLQLAARTARTAGLDPMSHPMFADSTVVQAFAKLGRLFGETSLVTGDPASSASGGLMARITEIQDPKSSALMAREYRGEFGPERQAQAAETLRGLLKQQTDSLYSTNR